VALAVCSDRAFTSAATTPKPLPASIVLIFLVLGTIGLGLATPTKAGAMGLAALHRRLTWPLVEQAMTSTMRLTTTVVFILIGSTCFSLPFRAWTGRSGSNTC